MRRLNFKIINIYNIYKFEILFQNIILILINNGIIDKPFSKLINRFVY